MDGAGHGNGVYQVAVGPIHAGVIESGHFRFHVVGDRILHLDTRLFYKHRGLERAAEQGDLADGASYVGAPAPPAPLPTACLRPRLRRDPWAHTKPGASPGAHDPARARTSLEPPQRHRRHLRRCRPRRRHQPLRRADRTRPATQRPSSPGTASSSKPSSSAAAAPARRHDPARRPRELDAIRTETEGGWRELQFNASFQDRLPDIGVLGREDVERLGSVGPAARAAGVSRTLARFNDRLEYPRLRAPDSRATPRRRPRPARAAHPRAATDLRPSRRRASTDPSPQLPARPLAPNRRERPRSSSPRAAQHSAWSSETATG